MSYQDLPSLSELIKPHECKISKSDLICKCKNAEESSTKKKQLDSRLKNWQEWMQRRKRMHLKLGKLLQREPGGLVMNNFEELRLTKEKKLAFEYAKLAQYRECKLPTIEYIGVPEKIKHEKNVMPRPRNTYTSWEQTEYFKNKTQKLSFELNLVEGDKPESTDFYIQGFSLSDTKTNLIEQSNFEKLKENLQLPMKDNIPKKLNLCLDVNNLLVSPNIKNSITRKVYIMFDYDITKNQVDTQYLTVQNLGCTAIHFHWKSFQTIQLFKDILPQTTPSISFYFNKNPGVIIPGQTVKLPIWFKCVTPGVYLENWEFCTRPRILPGTGRLIIVLHASAVLGDLNEKMEVTREHLDNMVRTTLIKETLSSVLSDVTSNRLKPITYSYNKKEVFEAISGKYDPLNLQPNYLYSKDVVRELQKFYKNVRQKTDPKSWNYNIHELRILTNAKQRKDELEKESNEQQYVKKLWKHDRNLSLADVPKNVFPDSRSLQKIPKDTVSHSNRICNLETNLSEELEKIIAKLKLPLTKPNYKLNTYTHAYLILCTCFNKIETDIETMKEKMGIKKKSLYPKLQSFKMPSLQLQHEYLFDVFAKPPLTENITYNRDLPINECIRDIPKENCKLRFQTYYNIADSNFNRQELSKKGAGKTDKKDVKETKDNTKGKPEERSDEEDDGYTINEAFNPYENIELIPHTEYVNNETDSESLNSLDEDVLPAVLCQYNYNIYVIIYKYLKDAIGSIVDMLEIQSHKSTPYTIIKELEEPNYTRRLIDLKSLLIQENLDNVKAKVILHNYRKNSKLDWKNIEIQRQLKHVKSDSSLWTVLKSYTQKTELSEDKPISYPIEDYEEDVLQYKQENNSFIPFSEATSTADCQIDPNLTEFQDRSIQTDYKESEVPADLEAYIEKIKSETSVQSLVDFKFDKKTQKNIEDHVSEEEHFYYSISDSELSNISIESQESHESVCVCKGQCSCCEMVE